MVACGGNGGSSSPSPAPPTPNPVGYSTANLNGNYVFSLSGVGLYYGEPFAVVGVFTADGNGNNA